MRERTSSRGAQRTLHGRVHTRRDDPRPRDTGGAAERVFRAVRYQRRFFPDGVCRALVDLGSGRPGNPDRFRQRLGRRTPGAGRPSGAGLGLEHPEAGRTRTAAPGFRRLFCLALPAAVPVRRVLAGAVPLHRRFHRLGLGELRALSRHDARDRRPQLRLGAGHRLSHGVQQYAGRTERLSHRGADRRHALSDSGAADPRRRLPGASELQAAIRPVVSDRADRGLAMDGVFHRRCHRGRFGVRILARLRHRELAGASSTGCRCSRRLS